MAKKTQQAADAANEEALNGGADVATDTTDLEAENAALKQTLAEQAERLRLLEKHAPANMPPITKVNGVNVKVKHGAQVDGVAYTREEIAGNPQLIAKLLERGSSAVAKISA